MFEINKVKISLEDSSRREIVISESLTKAIHHSRILLHFGQWKKELKIVVDSGLNKDTIRLPRKLFKGLTIPEELPYEIRVKDINLYLGPVIGFVPVGRSERLTEENLQKFIDYMRCYSKISGLIYIFAGNGIDFQSQTIEGYYYDPKNHQWKEGVFPFPYAIYRKTGFAQSITDGLTTAMGDKMFNTYFFNKWETWEALSKSPSVKDYLPYTERLKDAAQLDRLLKEFDQVYLKQEAGHKAKGIVRVHKSDKGYHFVYRLKGEKMLNTHEEINHFLSELNEKKNYIVQQAIPVKQYDERNFDFRVILQKDDSKEWVCPGIVGRFGKKGSIATNFLLDGFSLNGIESLKLVFNLNEREAFIKQQEIIRACREASTFLNQTIGHYGDLGIDVMVDENFKVWILEINKLHDHKFPLYGLENAQMYYNVLANPLLYAKALAGF